MDRVRSLATLLLIAGCFGLRFVPASAAVLTSLYSFSPVSSSPTMNPDGARPYAGLVEGSDGNFYGAAPYAGPNNDGTLFKITPSGALTVLVAFTGTNGANPSAALTIGSDGNFYGTTQRGGASGTGTLFVVTPQGTLTTLHSFSALDSNGFNSDGAQPESSLLSFGNGFFFGTTVYGGTDGEGTVFRITTDGTAHGTTLTSLVSFTDTSGPNLGAYPYGGLVFSSSGVYGTTSQGGLNDTGTIYKVTSAGVLTTIYNFTALTGGKNADGSHPNCTLVQGGSGDLYGTTDQGGPNADGTVFSMTPNGVLTTLAAFDGANGAAPNAGVIEGADGSFYGTTSAGGANNTGTLYDVTSAGTLTTLHDFSAVTTTYPYMNSDGAYPLAALIRAGDGGFYGTTYSGGTNGEGTVFRLSLAPSITSFSPASGPVGTVVTILGTGLSGVSAVRFHNASASVFSANAAGTQLTVTVPHGAATGTITVTTPSGSVKTATPFTVTVPPAITSFSPTSGPVGTLVTIMGANLNGVTAVRFHNASATDFTANASGTQLVVFVPSGAATGTITVTTPSGSVKTATPFTVN